LVIQVVWALKVQSVLKVLWALSVPLVQLALPVLLVLPAHKVLLVL
jgi:hypothetical protein